MSTIKAIECELSPGMFSDEWLVKFHLHGNSYSFFVPRDAAQELGSGRGRLKVEVLDPADPSVVVVPDEGRTAIGVQNADLVEA